MKQKKGKRMLSFLVTLAMVIGLLPGMSLTAYADGQHTHTHDSITFVEWTDTLAQEQWGSGCTAANSLPNVAGNYYLTKDVTLTNKWTVPSGTTNLCLGGNTITGKLSESVKHDSSAVNIIGNSTLNLYDDQEGTGTIASDEYEFSYEGSNPRVQVRVVDTFDGTFNLYGGTLCATEGNQVYSGVYVNGGSFTMNGGTIRGARASGVDVGSRGGVFTMNGGKITGNEASQGGGVFVQKNGTFTMNGGSIKGNKALANETQDEDGSPMYKGGRGGGVFVEAGGENDSDGVFTMNGGSVTGNDAQRHGGGVYNKGKFRISGSPEISGNTHTRFPGYSYADNVYLLENSVINVAGELANTKCIGITMQVEGVFTSGKASACKEKFTSDSEEFVVAVKGDELMLQHIVHGMSYDKSGATVTAECAWPDSCSLPDGKVALTIKAPTLTTYGGTGNAEATLEGLADFNTACRMSLAENDIKYYRATKSGSTYTKEGGALPAAPTDAGDYLAEMPVPTDGDGSYVYAAVGYTIAKTDDGGGSGTPSADKVRQVRDKINALADPSKASADQVADAVAAYKALSDKEKALITEAERKTLQAAVDYPAASRKASLNSVKARKGGKAVVKWKKKSGINGYQLVYSTNRKFTKKTTKKANIKKYKTVKKTVKKLKKGRTYYFRICTYTEVEDISTEHPRNVYGKWSKVKKIRAKK